MVLAGPDAGEIGCLRHYLGFQADRTWFVENDKKHKAGLEKVRREWPGANAKLMDVKDVLSSLADNSVAFLHLDFMGYLNGVRRDIVLEAAQKMAVWGTIFYVFFRGRERDGVGFWTELKKDKSKTLDGKRFVGGAKILSKALGWDFVPIFSLRYTSVAARLKGSARKGDMGIIGFQRLPSTVERSDYWLRMLEEPSPYGGVVPTDDRLCKEYLRIKALELRRSGHKSKEVAAILNTNPGTVAAWFALQSQGAYNP